MENPREETGPQILFQGRRFRVASVAAAGAGGKTLRKEVVLHPGAVAVLPFVDAARVCLIRNLRPAVGEMLLEVPAGTLEPGEPPEATAARELEEETGYRAALLHKVCEFYPSPGVLSEKMHLFVAEELTPGRQDLEDDEDIQTCVVEFSQAVAWALDGTIRDAKTMVALLLWANRFVGT